MSNANRQKVLLIGWDGADWEHITPLLEEGLMPNLEGMINRGVMGNLATLQPVLSPMLWNSIATGKLADKHGILGFMEPDPDRGGARPYSSLSRKCKAIWNILNQEGMRSNVVAWWASHPAEPINGAVVSNMFNQVRRNPVRVPPGTIHPKEREEELGDLRVEPRELTEADILPFIPKAAEIDQQKDPRLGIFQKILSDCASVQAVSTRLMEDEDWDFSALYFDAVDHVCHAFVMYHPPRQEHIPEDLFEMYKDVLRTTYRFHDMMLARQLQLAGPEALVVLCSDHGFHSRHLRPAGTPREPAGPASWHRDMGIIVMSGPGIRKDERIYGANVIDITPTLLAAMGLPVGEDMDGRVLGEVFETLPEVRTIPSWEEVDGDSGMHPPGTAMDAEMSEELTKQFVALGYVDDHGEDKQKAEESARTEADYNLARMFFSCRRYDEALPLFERCLERHPWEERFVQHLVITLVRGGYAAQALRLIAAAYPEGNLPVSLVMVRIEAIERVEGREAASEALNRVPREVLRLPMLQRQLGRGLLRQGRTREAEAALRRAIELDEDDYASMGELAMVCLRQRRWREAAELALDSVGRLHQQPLVHQVLGQALMRLGYVEQAARAFENALTMRPGLYASHRHLERIHGRIRHDPEKAARHHLEARRIRAERREAVVAGGADRAHRTWELPDLPPPHERRARLLEERRTAEEQEALKGSSGKTFTIVSGLPRSGTSLMMQMLRAGGMEPQTDEIRAADEDNPEGYWEWEALKRSAELPELFEKTAGLEGRAIKAVTMVLPHLPPEHHYKVLFMMRPVSEVARSQGRMIEGRGTEGAAASPEELERKLEEHRKTVRRRLAREVNFEVLDVSYPEVIRNPGPACEKIAAFLGGRLPHPERMAQVIRPDLYRQRDDKESAR